MFFLQVDAGETPSFHQVVAFSSLWMKLVVRSELDAVIFPQFDGGCPGDKTQASVRVFSLCVDSFLSFLDCKAYYFNLPPVVVMFSLYEPICNFGFV